MKHKIILLLFTCLSAYLSGQTNKGKDLVFRVKTQRTTVQIFPDIAWIDAGASKMITIRIKPTGRKIGKVTFKGGKILGRDSTYILSAGIGSEGILSVYEKTPAGNKLIINKVYPFKRVVIKTAPKLGSDNHVCYPNDGHHPGDHPKKYYNYTQSK